MIKHPLTTSAADMTDDEFADFIAGQRAELDRIETEVKKLQERYAEIGCIIEDMAAERTRAGIRSSAPLTTEHKGRTYDLTIDDRTMPNLREHLIGRGFDGLVYNGVSRMVGRQRTTRWAVFYRRAVDGEFVCVAVQ